MLNLNNVLLVLNADSIDGSLRGDVDFLIRSFCGVVVVDGDVAPHPALRVVYLCGNLERAVSLPNGPRVFAIRELSVNVGTQYDAVPLGHVPCNIHGVGVFFRDLFADRTCFERITKEHAFQSLTLADKPGSAFRQGIYLTKVEEDADALLFRVLRCSTNLAGPTDNLRGTDVDILRQVNAMRELFFVGSAELNHVLAQTYHNSSVAGKQKKAKISEHSDKTKDMPDNGLIAFCTFYEGFASGLGSAQQHGFDWVYGKSCKSVLTKLRFRLKKQAHDGRLEEQFDVTLFPNSVFIIPLLMNRLYTHEILPSELNVEHVPTRLGYVIRCSNTEAVHVQGHTWVKRRTDAQLVKLEPPTTEGLKELRQLYYLENTTTDQVNYTDRFFFSMNSGDYLPPLL